MTPPQIVKYSRPQSGEEDARFVLVEDNGDRVLIELICDLPIRPRECVAKDEVKPANSCTLPSGTNPHALPASNHAPQHTRQGAPLPSEFIY